MELMEEYPSDTALEIQATAIVARREVLEPAWAKEEARGLKRRHSIRYARGWLNTGDKNLDALRRQMIADELERLKAIRDEVFPSTPTPRPITSRVDHPRLVLVVDNTGPKKSRISIRDDA